MNDVTTTAAGGPETEQKKAGQNDLFGHADLTAADVLQHLRDPALLERWPHNLRDLLDVSAHAMRKEGRSDDDAQRLSAAVVLAIAEFFGGCQFYFPKGELIRAALRDRAIWQAFNGRNVFELVRHFKLTEVRIYQILSEQRALHSKRVQFSLFE